MKRTFPALVVAVLGAGLALAGTAAPASAATESVTNTVAGTCEALTVDLSGYAVEAGADAVTETVVVTPAVAEVSHTDYVYKPLIGKMEHVSHKDAGWSLCYDWTWYYFSGETRTHIEVPGQDAVTEEREVTPAIPANAEPNTVTVTIDGTDVVAAEAFGAGYSNVFALAKGTPGTDTYATHTYSVSVTAYQGHDAEATTSVVASDTTNCATGDFAAVAAIDTTTTCGTAVVSLTNAALLASKVNGTYSAVISVDGNVKDILAVFENKAESKTYAFAEDSGDHVIEVRTGSAHGNTLLATATVDTDCTVGEEEPAPPVEPSIAVTGSLIPGGTITVAGTDFAADTAYDVELHSTPQSIASVTSDADGAFSADGAIAADTEPGEHTVVVLDESGNEVASVPVTITAVPTEGGTGTGGGEGTGTTAGSGTSSDLAATGFDALPLAAIAAALLALAGIAFGTRRAIRVKG